MPESEGWVEARRSWMCGCLGCICRHVIPAGDLYFRCDGVRYCRRCAQHMAGRCAELLARGVLA